MGLGLAHFRFQGGALSGAAPVYHRWAETVPSDWEGFVGLDVPENMLHDLVIAASIMAVNNGVGTVQDLPGIAGLVWRSVSQRRVAAPGAVDTAHLSEYKVFPSGCGKGLWFSAFGPWSSCRWSFRRSALPPPAGVGCSGVFLFSVVPQLGEGRLPALAYDAHKPWKNIQHGVVAGGILSVGMHQKFVDAVYPCFEDFLRGLPLVMDVLAGLLSLIVDEGRCCVVIWALPLLVFPNRL